MRFSTVRSDHIEYAFWLVFDGDGNMRFARGEPSIGRGERAMSCSATLPRSLFSVPTLKARIGVAAPLSSDYQIDVEAASEALSMVVGCDVEMHIQPKEPT